MVLFDELVVAMIYVRNDQRKLQVFDGADEEVDYLHINDIELETWDQSGE